MDSSFFNSPIIYLALSFGYSTKSCTVVVKIEKHQSCRYSGNKARCNWNNNSWPNLPMNKSWSICMFKNTFVFSNILIFLIKEKIALIILIWCFHVEQPCNCWKRSRSKWFKSLPHTSLHSPSFNIKFKILL